MPRHLNFRLALSLLTLIGCGDDSSVDSGVDAERPDARGVDAPGVDAPGVDATVDGSVGERPHPLYPPLDLATLPGDGGGAIGAYEPPALPTTTATVTVSTTGTDAGRELMDACETAGTEVIVPDAAGRIGIVNIGNVQDCDIQLGPMVIIDTLVVGSLPGPTLAPSNRIRIRGGQIGSMLVMGPSTDIVFDGVAINTGVVSDSRNGTAINVREGDGEPVNRFAVVNSFVRVLPVDQGGGDIDGTSFLGVNTQNVFFANNNIVTSGNRNSWGFRFNGGNNAILIDNSVRVSFHKLVRLNSDPVDYVYIKGGTWMREATTTAGGDMNNDSFQQLSGSTTDNVLVHDAEVYLLPSTRCGFGMTFEEAQAGRLWEARRIHWHALSEDVISAARLDQLEGLCPAGATCDYASETHTFDYDPGLTFPANPWRDLPTFDDDDPDSLPAL